MDKRFLQAGLAYCFALKKRLFLCLLLSLFLFFPVFPAMLSAQVVIEEEETKEEGKETTGLEYWDKHFAVYFGTSIVTGLGVSDYRRYSFINLSWKHDLDWIAFNFEGEAYRRDARYTLEAIPEVPGSERNKLLDENQEITISFRESNADYREANIKLNPIDYLQISVGYHTITWGQISNFSPVDYFLPRRASSGSLSFSKVDGRLSQLAAILYIFPIPEIEIQAYYFPQLTIDNVFRKYLVEFNQKSVSDNKRDPENRLYETQEALVFPEKSEEAQYAVRLLFYFDWMTFGFTYYETWSQFFPEQNREIDLVPTQNSNEDNYYVTDRPTLPRIQNYGFESSVPIGSWEIAFDIVHRVTPSEVRIDIGPHNRIRESIRKGSLPSEMDQAAQTARQNLINYILEERSQRGSLEYESLATLWALATSYDSDDWNFSFGIAFFHGPDPRGEEDKKLKSLEEEADRLSGNSIEIEKIPGVPFLSLSYYLTSGNKNNLVGLAAGFLGSTGFGAALYWGDEYFESLQLGVSLEVLQLFSSSEAADVLEGYKLKNELYPGLRLVCIYKF